MSLWKQKLELSKLRHLRKRPKGLRPKPQGGGDEPGSTAVENLHPRTLLIEPNIKAVYKANMCFAPKS